MNVVTFEMTKVKSNATVNVAREIKMNRRWEGKVLFCFHLEKKTKGKKERKKKNTTREI